MRDFALRACGCTIALHTDDADAARLLVVTFGALRIAPDAPGQPVLALRVARRASGRGYNLSDGTDQVAVDDATALLHHVDKRIAIALQRQRPDLLFLHAAAVASKGRVAVLAAAPNTGKSTLALAVLALGLEYLSDELAPIDPASLVVEPYPRALCLKTAVPEPLVVPVGAVSDGRRLLVPFEAASPVPGGYRLAALVFLDRDAPGGPALSPLTSAAAAAHVMRHALNPSAHADEGLDAAVRLAARVPSFGLATGDLAQAAAAVRAVLD